MDRAVVSLLAGLYVLSCAVVDVGEGVRVVLLCVVPDVVPAEVVGEEVDDVGLGGRRMRSRRETERQRQEGEHDRSVHHEGSFACTEMGTDNRMMITCANGWRV